MGQSDTVIQLVVDSRGALVPSISDFVIGEFELKFRLVDGAVCYAGWITELLSQRERIDDLFARLLEIALRLAHQSDVYQASDDSDFFLLILEHFQGRLKALQRILIFRFFEVYDALAVQELCPHVMEDGSLRARAHPLERFVIFTNAIVVLAQIFTTLGNAVGVIQSASDFKR